MANRDDRKLTVRQQSVYDFICECHADGFIPTLNDICDKFGFASRMGANCHIAALMRKGYLSKRPGGQIQLNTTLQM